MSKAGEAKLREWAREHVYVLTACYCEDCQNDVAAAAESLIRQCAEILDVCECGDYRHQHVDCKGPCRVCGQSRAPYDGCQKFRKSKVATGAEAILRYYGIPEGK